MLLIYPEAFLKRPKLAVFCFVCLEKSTKVHLHVEGLT